MSGRLQFWTEARRERLRAWYLEDVREHGMTGALRTLGVRFDKSLDSVRGALRSLPDWEELRASAHKMTEERQATELAVTVTQEEHDPADPALRAAERRVITLGDEVRTLRTKLRASDRKEGIVLELADQLEGIVQPILQPEWPQPKPAPTEREEVDAFVTLSDQHGDRIVRTTATWGLERYDFNVFRCRLWEWAKTIGRYCSVHLPNYKFETLWVAHLGDAVQGDIHNMKHKNFFPNSMVAALAIGDLQSEVIAYLTQFFNRVAVVCVPGNHGRTTKQVQWEDPYDNFDYLVAKAMQLRLDGWSNVDVFTPRAWTAFVDVRGYLWCLNHGHGVRGQLGIPWYGFEKREGRVQRLASFTNRPVDYFGYGHFHTPMTRPSGRGKSVHSGAWYMTDEYAINELAVGNPPEQTLLMFSERFGRQAEIPLMVRDEKREQEMFDGNYEPPLGRKLIVDEPADPPMGTAPIIT